MNPARTGEAIAELDAENERLLTLAARRMTGAFEACASGFEAEFDGDVQTPLALAQLARRFGLSRFERDLLLLCALVERDAELADAVRRCAPEHARSHPTLALARAVLPGASLTALSPFGALRRWRMLELASDQPLITAALTVDERVQFHLEGQRALDPRLESTITPLRGGTTPHDELAKRLASAVRGANRPRDCPALEISGARSEDRSALIVRTCELLGLTPYSISADVLPSDARERDAFARLWERESMLSEAMLVVEARAVTAESSERIGGLLRVLDALVCVSLRTRLPVPCERPFVRVEVPRPTATQEEGRWRRALGPHAGRVSELIPRAAMQFALDDAALRAVAAAVALEPCEADAARRAWSEARAYARHDLDLLAERVDAAATWTELVLPEDQRTVLRNVASHVRERHRVYAEWGFAQKSSRGLGISALFCGPSGTGKTLAAEVLAAELDLDLYRVDLAKLVSKYIGETEKNLARVFDAAEASGAILLFDEADAIFGKRSEVRDSHDRYANLEISYLLQRVETYRGLAILTSNMKDAIDTAFLRRIRFIVHFPFPDAAARRSIWAQVFPPAVPRDELDLARLSRLNVAGGQIRNIAMNAAFIAARERRALGMRDLRAAAEAEFAKLEKPLHRAEIGDWA